MTSRSGGQPPRSRRRLLGTLLGVGVAALAGCVGRDGDGTEAVPGQPATAADDPTPQPNEGTDPTASTDPLDIREANVVGVRVEPTNGGYRFDVTLVHDDDGEAGYANWWQVESLAGERLGRRELLHAHGSEPFTRTTMVPVPDELACVVVRGHDTTHGYGGQAMAVDLETGATRTVRQGSDPRTMTPADCPDG